MKHVKSYLNGHPRPQFSRKNYQLLDGKWDFCFDEDNLGESQNYQNGFATTFQINVPFVYTTELSGINIQKRYDYLWYSRIVKINKSLESNYLLHFDGSDYKTIVWVNGQMVGSLSGGYHRLTFDITDYLKSGDNLLVVKVEDDFSIEKPRGKQRWKPANFECWYVETTGIYKSVWLEEVGKTYLESVKMTPSVDNENIEIIYQIANPTNDYELLTRISFSGELISEVKRALTAPSFEETITLPKPLKLWDVGIINEKQPNLYDIEFIIQKDNVEIDHVYSYFGLRKIEIKNSKIYLNNQELYQKLILDQGYWQKSHLTPPSEEALLYDIEIMMKMGFNGARKHQKTEINKFLYYSDLLGYLVWAEMPSMYKNTTNSRAVFKKEWLETVVEQYNHPCIITWTPLNESWGIPSVKDNLIEQEFTNEIYHLTKAYDKTRPVITNDGWEHTISDILTIHHYEQDGSKLHNYFSTIDKAIAPIFESHHKGAFADGYEYQKQPIIFSEFGGTAFVKDAQNGSWGYGNGVKDEEEFIKRFTSLIDALDSLEYSAGYCYTQLSDVQQEVNGLLYENRLPKIDVEIIKKILTKNNR